MRLSEQRNPNSFGLDIMETEEVLRVINDEDQSVAHRVRRAIPQIARGVDLLVAAMEAGGRIIHVGAGTSARLAVADLAELPPTYSLPQERLLTVIAGGKEAVFSAREGAEDEETEAVRRLERIGPGPRDVVVGISASGSTPFVAAALDYARSCKSKTMIIACNSTAIQADVSIIVETGPEVVTGSTRMKAGMAQRMVLTMLSTTMAVRLGRVYDNLMVAMDCRNRKCLQRARRMVQEITGEPETSCEEALSAADGSIRLAVLYLHTQNLQVARSLLERSGGSLRRALEQVHEPIRDDKKPSANA